jgi:hypothetical protein
MDTNMVDEDAKQLLRDILSTQREQLALSQRIAEDQARQISAYAANSEQYRQHLSEWQLKREAWRWADAIRAITAVGIALLLGYVVLSGLHAR